MKTENVIEKSIKNINALAEFATEFAGDISGRVVVLTGDLGAGKTTFCNLLCSSLGVKSGLSSPTFSVINEYEAEHGKIFHMDWYRIENVEDLMNIGIEEYLYSGNTCLIEWPEVGASLLPDQYIHIHIVAEADESRTIHVKLS